MKKTPLLVTLASVTALSLGVAAFSVGALVTSSATEPETSQPQGGAPAAADSDRALAMSLSVGRNARYQSPYQVLAALNAMGVECPGGSGVYQGEPGSKQIFTALISCGKDEFTFDIATFSSRAYQQQFLSGGSELFGHATGLKSYVSGSNWVVTAATREIARAVAQAIGGRVGSL